MVALPAFLLLLTYLHVTLASVLLRNGSSVAVFQTPKWKAGADFFDVTGPLILEAAESKLGACEPDPRAKGHIILATRAARKCSFETLTRACKQVGCRGVVLSTKDEQPGRDMYGYWWEKRDHGNTLPPLVAMQLLEFEEVVRLVAEESESVFNHTANSTTTGLEMRLTSDVVSVWEIGLAHPAWHVVRVVLSVMAIVNVGLAGYKLAVKFIKSRTWLAIVCLSLEFIGNLLRFFYLAIDPYHSSRLLSFPMSSFLLLVPIPISLLAAVFVALFWLEMTAEAQRGRTVGGFLRGRFKWCAICTAIFLLVLEITARVTTAVFLTSLEVLSYITGPLTVFISLLFTVFLIFAGCRVWRYLTSLGPKRASRSDLSRPTDRSGNSQSSLEGRVRSATGGRGGQRRKKRTASEAYSRRLVVFIITSCMFRITTNIGGTMMSTVTTVEARIFSFLLYELSLSLVSTFQILVFQHGDRSRVKSSRSSKSEDTAKTTDKASNHTADNPTRRKVTLGSAAVSGSNQERASEGSSHRVTTGNLPLDQVELTASSPRVLADLKQRDDNAGNHDDNGENYKDEDNNAANAAVDDRSQSSLRIIENPTDETI